MKKFRPKCTFSFKILPKNNFSSPKFKKIVLGYPDRLLEQIHSTCVSDNLAERILSACEDDCLDEKCVNLIRVAVVE